MNSISGNSRESISNRPYLEHARYVIVKVHEKHREKMAKVDCVVDSHLGGGPQGRIHELCVERKRNKAEISLTQKNNLFQQRLEEIPSMYETGGLKQSKSKFRVSKSYGLYHSNRLPPVSVGNSVCDIDDIELSSLRSESNNSSGSLQRSCLYSDNRMVYSPCAAKTTKSAYSLRDSGSRKRRSRPRQGSPSSFFDFSLPSSPAAMHTQTLHGSSSGASSPIRRQKRGQLKGFEPLLIQQNYPTQSTDDVTLSSGEQGVASTRSDSMSVLAECLISLYEASSSFQCGCREAGGSGEGGTGECEQLSVQISYSPHNSTHLIIRILTPHIAIHTATPHTILDTILDITPPNIPPQVPPNIILSERSLLIEHAKLLIPPLELNLNRVDLSEALSAFTSERTRTVDLYSSRAAVSLMFAECLNLEEDCVSYSRFIELLGGADPAFKTLLRSLSLYDVSELIAETDTDTAIDIPPHNFTRFASICVTMLLTIRVRNHSRALTEREEQTADRSIRSIMAAQKLSETSESCLQRFALADSPNLCTRTGILRVLEFQECLSGVKSEQHTPLTAAEISAVKKLMPKDPFGSIYYATFPEVLEKIRFTALKKNFLENNGTRLQKVLLEECRKGEQDFYVPSSLQNLLSKNPYAHSGLLCFRDLVTVLYRSPNVGLSRLQIHILLSGSKVAADKKIDYYQLVPMLANAVDLLLDAPAVEERALLVRAALLRCTGGIPRTYTHTELTALAHCVLGSAVRAVRTETGAVRTDVPYLEDGCMSGGLGSKGVQIQFRGDDAVVVASRPARNEESSLVGRLEDWIRSGSRGGSSGSGSRGGGSGSGSWGGLDGDKYWGIEAVNKGDQCQYSERTVEAQGKGQGLVGASGDEEGGRDRHADRRSDSGSFSEPVCVLQVRHSPSTPHLLSLRYLMHSKRSTVVICERTARMDSEGTVTPSTQCFGLDTGDVTAVCFDDVIAWSTRLLGEVRLSSTEQGTTDYSIRFPGEEEEEALAAQLKAELEGMGLEKDRAAMRSSSARRRQRSCLGDESVFEHPRVISLRLVVSPPPLRVYTSSRRRHEIQFEFDSNGVPSLRNPSFNLGLLSKTPSRAQTPVPSPVSGIAPWRSPASRSSSPPIDRVKAYEDSRSNHTHAPTSVPVIFSIKTAGLTEGGVSPRAPCLNSSKDIVATVLAVDSSFTASLALPVKLPTLALIDREAAEEFVVNLVRELYLEVPHDWDGCLLPQLKMK